MVLELFRKTGEGADSTHTSSGARVNGRPMETWTVRYTCLNVKYAGRKPTDCVISLQPAAENEVDGIRTTNKLLNLGEGVARRGSRALSPATVRVFFSYT